MTKIPSPKPETLSAYLESAGLKTKKATLHVYVDTRETIADGPAWEHIFRCTETNVERRWGVVDRLVFKGMEEGN